MGNLVDNTVPTVLFLRVSVVDDGHIGTLRVGGYRALSEVKSYRKAQPEGVRRPAVAVRVRRV